MYYYQYVYKYIKSIDDIQWPLIRRKLEVIGASIDGGEGVRMDVETPEKNGKKIGNGKDQLNINRFFGRQEEKADEDFIDEFFHELNPDNDEIVDDITPYSPSKSDRLSFVHPPDNRISPHIRHDHTANCPKYKNDDASSSPSIKQRKCDFESFPPQCEQMDMCATFKKTESLNGNLTQDSEIELPPIPRFYDREGSVFLFEEDMEEPHEIALTKIVNHVGEMDSETTQLLHALNEFSKGEKGETQIENAIDSEIWSDGDDEIFLEL